MRVGITGHQRLDDATAWHWVEEAIRAELDRSQPPIVAVTSLAIGADQLLARLVLERGGEIHAVIPFEGIERSFSADDIHAFAQLKARSTLEVLHTPGTDEDAYFAAGKRVVDLSDIVIAVWNGKPAKGKGGTADVVAYSIERGVPLLHIEPVTKSMTRIGVGEDPAS